MAWRWISEYASSRDNPFWVNSSSNVPLNARPRVRSWFVRMRSGKTDIVSITGSYALAPGVSIYSEIDFVAEESNTNLDNDGTVYMIGTSVSF